MRKPLVAAILLALALPAFAQRVDSTNSHYRLWVLDRVAVDPQGRRMPAHASGTGILGFVALYSPNGSLCLVEYVAEHNSDFDALRADAAADPVVRIWEKAFTRHSVFEAAAKAAGFTQLNLDKFFVRVP